MIRGLILDVDGVIIGSKKGYNWPLPHPDVIRALKTIRSRGAIVSLCTGKGTFAMKEIVKAAHLNNLHIGGGGAVVMDFLEGVIIEKHVVAKAIAQRVLTTLLKRGTYVEVYTVDGYYVQADAVCDITAQHTAILSREPFLVDSLYEVMRAHDIVKIMPVAKNEADKQAIITALNPFQSAISLQWGVHPTAVPLQFGIVTAPHISKKHAAEAIAKHTHVPLDQMLGVGDGLTDWNFIELCGYAGVMGNVSEELKTLAVTKGAGRFFIGPDVNENGLLGILRHFQMLKRRLTTLL